jgi:hypothetical protein
MPKNTMQRLAAYLFILGGLSATALAGGRIAPEIDGTTAASAVAVLAGAVLIIRARRAR